MEVEELASGGAQRGPFCSAGLQRKARAASTLLV
jgi:hypothetical protein